MPIAIPFILLYFSLLLALSLSLTAAAAADELHRQRLALCLFAEKGFSSLYCLHPFHQAIPYALFPLFSHDSLLHVLSLPLVQVTAVAASHSRRTCNLVSHPLHPMLMPLSYAEIFARVCLSLPFLLLLPFITS